MVADASIFAAFRQPVRSVGDYLAEYDAREGNALQLAARRMQMRQAQRAAADEDAVRLLSQQAGGDENALVGLLRRGGYWDKAAGVQKGIDERLQARSALDTAEVMRRKAEQEITTAQINDAKKRIDLAGSVFKFVMENPSAENAIRAVDHLAQNGVWDQAAAQKAIGEVQADPTPQNIARLAELAFRGALDADKQLMSFAQQERGGTAATMRYNPVTGAVTDAQSVQKTPTPGEVLADTRSKATLAETERHNKEVERRMREKAGQGGGSSAIIDAGGTSQAALTKLFGKAEPGRRWKPDGSQEPIPGGSADRKSNEQQAGKETVDSVVAGLRASYDALDKGGGITSTAQGAISNLGRRVSQSAVGQFAGGAIGSQNQKERDSIAQARPLLLQAIMKATGMSAKQMDSNAELKLYLATATDPTLSLEANREALNRIAELYGGGATPKAPKPMSPEDTQALEWANKNPGDPRAQKIKARLGG